MKQVVMLSVLLAAAVPAAAQQIVRSGSTAAKPGPAENFTGRVMVRSLTSPTPPGQAGAGLVTFQSGARSNWHTHPAGQTLYVTQGCGWTQVEGQAVERICAGDTVYAAPGVKHWHGATLKGAMTHLAISEMQDGKNVDWLEPVTDAQYAGPAH